MASVPLWRAPPGVPHRQSCRCLFAGHRISSLQNRDIGSGQRRGRSTLSEFDNSTNFLNPRGSRIPALWVNQVDHDRDPLSGSQRPIVIPIRRLGLFERREPANGQLHYLFGVLSFASRTFAPSSLLRTFATSAGSASAGRLLSYSWSESCHCAIASFTLDSRSSTSPM